MGFELGSLAADAGTRLFTHDTVGSTNTEALALARELFTEPVWVVARRQTAGRGRRGRAWDTYEGNLAASLLIHADLSRQRAATLSFVAGLALTDAVCRLARHQVATPHPNNSPDDPRVMLTLKWPNDVLANGAKLAGILMEVERIAKDWLAVVVGFGVNVAAAPQDTPYPATSLHALGLDITAEALFRQLTDSWRTYYWIWSEGDGMAGIRLQWLEAAAGLGGPVAIGLGENIVRGTFETLDEEGRLIVISDDGARTAIAAGEVHFGAAASLA